MKEIIATIKMKNGHTICGTLFLKSKMVSILINNIYGKVNFGKLKDVVLDQNFPEVSIMVIPNSDIEKIIIEN